MEREKKERMDKIAEDLKKDECENPIKLSEYLEHCEYQNKLEDQLKENLQKADSRLNRCSYADKFPAKN